MKRLINLSLWLLFFFIPVYSNSQEAYFVQRGDRPVVILEVLPDDSWVPGKLRIKLHPDLSSIITGKTLIAGDAAYVKTDNQALDRLNKAFNVSRYEPLFRPIYESNSRSPLFRERHEAWGFHQWFELDIDTKANIADAVNAFLLLEEVICCEPEYRKHLVIEDLNLNSTSSQQQHSNVLSGGWIPNDPEFVQQWHYNNTGQHSGTPGADIALQDAWQIEKGTPEIIVAIIDGGIDYTHNDLAANIWAGIGYNFVSNTSTVLPHNHGTHIAGIVAASSNNGIGVAGIAGGSGTGDGVRLMSCQVFTNTGNGGFHLAPVFAADNGAAITQNSWGYTSPGVYEQLVLDAIDYFNIYGGGEAMDGGVSFFAAGNSNTTGQYYPACYEGAFSVTATNNKDQKSWYSNFDTWIDIAAPGGEIISLVNTGVLSTVINNEYSYYQGTSMACPHVTGVAALVISSAYGQIQNNQLTEVLKNSADDIYYLNPSYLNMLGAGRINAYNALIEIQSYLPGVNNPLYIHANVVTLNEINISWSKNINYDEVMLAWSPTGDFGSPIDGIVYETGESLPGGGYILYNGNQTTYNHANLEPATHYFYKIWSRNDLVQYSHGKTADAQTLCQEIITLPFAENFNAKTSLPFCWNVADNLGNGQVWAFGNFNNQVSGTTGNVAYLNSMAYGFGNSQNTDLITPVMNLSNYSEVSLSFKHYFRQYGNASSATLWYSIDDGLSWVQIQKWTATTPNPSSFSMALPGVDGQAVVRFKWSYSGTWAYYWSFDDVEVTGIYSVPSTYFIAQPTHALVGDVVTYSDMLGSSNYTNLEWNFGEGADPQSATGYGPHDVIYYTDGSKTVSLMLDGVQTEVKTDYVSVSESINVFNEGFEPTIAANISLPDGWDIMRNSIDDGGLNGNNLVIAASDSWFVNSISSGLNPPEKYIYQGQASLAIDQDAPGLSWAISPEIIVPESQHIKLTFWLWYAYDDGVGPKSTKFYVNILLDDEWSTLESWLGAPNNMYEKQVLIDISAYSGEMVRFAFIYENADAYPVAIDEIEINSEASVYSVWLGRQSSGWNNPENWSSGVPNEDSYIVILPSDKLPVIDSNLTVGNITIASEAQLTLAPGSSLNVNSEIINKGGYAGLVLESGSGTGIADASIIHTTPGVEATVRRYISNEPYAWHQLSSPVANHYISAEIPGNFDEGNVFAWFEPAQTWVSYTNNVIWPTWEFVNGSDNFVSGKGYMVSYTGNPIKEFTGELNQGTISYDISYMAHPDENPGFNLVGNPYPSSIDWKSDSGWNRESLLSSEDQEGYTIWIWNPEYAQYGTYHSAALGDYGTNGVTRYIPPMQAFWVKAKENGSLGFNDQVRVHSKQPWLKNNAPEFTTLKFSITNSVNRYRDEIIVEPGHEKTGGGAKKMFSLNPTSPQMYITDNNENWSIYFLSDNFDSTNVSIGFVPAVSALYSLNLSGHESFDKEIVLEDTKAGLFHSLTHISDYFFTAEPSDDADRFVLHFRKSSTGFTAYTCASNPGFYLNNNVLYVTSGISNSQLHIYDIHGRTLLSKSLTLPGMHQFPLNYPAGIYMVRVITGKQMKAGKVILH